MMRLTRVVLPAPVGPTMATVWPGSHAQVEVLDERLVGRVGERHVLERDAALARSRPRRAWSTSGSCSARVEHLEHPLGRGHPGLEQVGHRGHLGQRLGELARVLDERLDVTEAHRAGRHPQPTDDGDDDVVEVPDEHHRRHDDAADELGAEGRVVQLVVLLLELRLRLPLTPEHLDQAVAGEGLLDDAVELDRWSSTAATNSFCDRLAIIAVIHMEIGMVTSAMSASDHEIAEHHGDHGDDGEQRGEQLAERLLQALLDVVDVVGDPAEQLAARLAVEVGQRQPVELGLDLLAAAS